MKKRKGATHVAVVLSFIIFITFLIFVYSYLVQPNLVQKNNGVVIESLKSKIVENVSKELTIISVKTESAPQDCIKLDSFISTFGIDSRVAVKDGSGTTQTFYVVGSNLEISRSGGGTFFKVYHSDEFEPASSQGESPCNPRNYDKGLVKKEKYVFENEIKNLISEYNESYNSIKENLGVPAGSEFGFGFEYSNGTEIKTERDSFSENVYSKRFPVIYTDNDSNIKFGFIIINLW